MQQEVLYISIGLGLIISITSLVYNFILRNKIRTILSVTDKKSLETYLEEVRATNTNTLKKLSEVEGIYTEVRDIAQRSLQKTSLVRFNPFKDTGGDQSFVVCMLDNQESGFIITAIHSREGTRVYTKQVINGNTKVSLSNEEKQALSKALVKN